MRHERPVSVLTLAILNIVFGSLGLLGMLCQGGRLVLTFAMNSVTMGPLGVVGGMVDFMEKEVPGYTIIEIASTLLGFTLAALFLVSGIGMLRLAPWARWTAFVCALLVIPWQVAVVTHTLLYVTPATLKWQHVVLEKMKQTQPAAAPQLEMQAQLQQSNPLLHNIGPIFTGIVVCAYPLALLALLFLPSVSAAFDRSEDMPSRDEPGVPPLPPDAS